MRILLPLSLITLGVSQLASASSCKCLPSSPCWPSPSDWESFNETVSGHLIRGVPPGSVCYTSEPNYSEQACAQVLANWSSSAFHSADPVSIDDQTWTNSSCDPIYSNGTSILGDPNAGKKGCSIGNYSPYVVNVTEPAHVKATLKFATEHNLRLNIKNTGHSDQGSIAHGSLSIWTHHMKDIEYHQSFHPQSCNSSTANWSGMAMTLGAGVQDGELFKAAAQYNAIAVGGTNSDVGVVGWATGGGHGLATGVYGMGADSIIEAVLLTPHGDMLTANACQNEDIFWAIRGGGGGTFGIILSVTVKAYPMPMVSLAGFNMAAKNTTKSKDWYRLVAETHKVFAQLQDKGVHGYYTMSGSPMEFNGALLLYNQTNSTSKDLLKPLQSFYDAANASSDSTVTVAPPMPWYSLVSAFPSYESVGTTKSVRASRFIPRRALENIELLAETLEKIASPKDTPKGVSIPSISGTMTGSSKAEDNALNPAWRDSIVHIITSQSWKDTLPETVENGTIYNMTYQKGYALRQLAPDTGCYLNEANPYEPDWQSSFFGPNYSRLLRIKEKYDPNGLLWCHHCVGSEAWTEGNDGSLCKASAS